MSCTQTTLQGMVCVDLLEKAMAVMVFEGLDGCCVHGEVLPVEECTGTGADDPQTSRHDLLAQHRGFLEASGATVCEGIVIELSPPVKSGLFARNCVTFFPLSHIVIICKFHLTR